VQVAGKTVLPNPNVAPIFGGLELLRLEIPVLHQSPPVRQVEVDFDERLKGLVSSGGVVRAEYQRQLRAVQQGVKVPPLNVRCGGIET
jgi:hypothetical protein